MQLTVAMLLDGVMRTLREAVLPAVGERFARGQLRLRLHAVAQVLEDVEDGEELAAREALPDRGQDGLAQRAHHAVEQRLDRELHAQAPPIQPRSMPSSRWRYGSWWSKIAMRRSAVRPSRNARRPVSMMAIILTIASTR